MDIWSPESPWLVSESTLDEIITRRSDEYKTHFAGFLIGGSSAGMIIGRKKLILPSEQRSPFRTSGQNFEELCEASDNI